MPDQLRVGYVLKQYPRLSETFILNEILGRPADAERPFLLLVTGHPAEGARVPAIERRSMAELACWFEAGPDRAPRP